MHTLIKPLFIFLTAFSRIMGNKASMPAAANEPVTHDFKLYEKVLYTQSNGTDVTKQITQINGNKITIINYDAGYGGYEMPIVVKPEQIRRITNSNKAKNVSPAVAAAPAPVKELYSVGTDVKVNPAMLETESLNATIKEVSTNAESMVVMFKPIKIKRAMILSPLPSTSNSMAGGRRSRRNRRSSRRSKRSAKK